MNMSKNKIISVLIVVVFCLCASAGLNFVLSSGVSASESTSVKIEHDSLLDGQKYAIGENSYAVEEGYIYDVSAFIRSQNATAQTDVRIDVEVYNSSDNKISDIAGRYYRLNCGANNGERVKSVNRPLMPQGAAYVKLYAYLTQGKATVYIDGISVYNAEENDEITVEELKFSASDDGWEFTSESGATITDDGGVKINVSNGSAELTKKIVSFHSDTEYSVSTEYASSTGFEVGIRFYDIYGEPTENGESAVYATENSSYNTITLTFAAPSHYYAVLFYKIKSVGEVTLKQGTIKETGSGNLLRSAEHWNMRGVGEITAEESVSGYSVKITADNTTDKPYVLCSDAIRLIKGKKYKLSYYVKVKNASAITFRAFLDLSNSGDGWVNYAGEKVTGNCDWEKRECEFVVSETSQLSALGFQILQGSGTAYIDGVKISCGDYVSTFLPSGVSVSAISEFETEADCEKEFSATLALSDKIKTNFVPRAKIKQNGKIVTTVSLDFSTPTNKLSVGENTVSVKFRVPIFLKKGDYALCLSAAQFGGSADLTLAKFKVTAEATTELPDCKVEVVNGVPAIVINGEPQSAVLYQKPYGTGFLRDGDENVYKSGINLYVTYKGNLAVKDALKNKAGTGMNDDMWKSDGSLDFSAFDDEINATLSADASAMVMVNISIAAPSWWLKENPGEACVLQDSSENTTTVNDASYASEKFIKEASEKLKEIVEHMCGQSYYSRIFGVKLSAGETFEWTGYGGSGKFCDYGDASLNGFKKYLTAKYENVSALRSAWGDNSVTFDTVTLPTVAERGESSLGMIVGNQKIIDFNAFVSYAASNAFLTYAKVVKDNIPNNLIVGGYNGYLWFANNYDGIYSSHTSVKTVLESDYVDFIASPANYNEKTLGRSVGVMSVADSARAYGKLYIIEEDDRTSFAYGYSDEAWQSSDMNSIGKTYSVTDTLNQIKRNAIYNFINGNGQWYFDMEGGWFDDEQCYSLMKTMIAESDYSLKANKNLNNEVAVFVSDSLYDYAAMNNGSSNPYYLYQYLYRMQRKNLDAAGVGYDVYAVSSLTRSLPEYKVYIMLAPVSLTDEERTAINTKLKKDGKYIVWVYLADFIKDGSTTLSAMSETVGMTIKTDTVSGKRFAVKFTGNNSLVSGLSGSVYGSSGTVKTVLPYVSDSKATTLGYLADYTSLISRRIGLAYKNCGTYNSVFSAAPNLPESFLRKIYAAAGVHIYDEDPNDVIWNNSSYVALHSAFSGEKTIKLNGNYAVYDVFGKRYIYSNTSEIVYTHIADDTKLFRLSKPKDEVKYISISLDGTLGLNFYVMPSKDYGELYAEMWTDGKNSERVAGVFDADKGLWAFSYGVAAKDYKKNVYIRIISEVAGDNELPIFPLGTAKADAEASVEYYASQISPEDKAYSAVKAMIDYCESARIYFADESAAVDGENITDELEKFRPSIVGTDGLVIDGASLVLESGTEIRLYFHGDVEGKSVTIDGLYAPVEKTSDGRNYISVKNIDAKNLGEFHTFRIGEYTVNYSALSYAYTVNADDKASAPYKNLIKKLYRYYEEAKKYFA